MVGSGRPADWADAVAAARLVLAAAGMTEDRVTVRRPVRPLAPGPCAGCWSTGGRSGAGELHPAVCDAWELPRRTCAMEVNLDAVPLPEVVTGPTVSSYPDPDRRGAAGRRDRTGGGGGTGAGRRRRELLESARLFDVYTGEQIGRGRRSLAYKLTFRAPDRTLTGEEAVAARDAAVAEAARRLGAELRGG